MVTQDEVDWNKAFFSESSDEESQIFFLYMCSHM